MVNDSVDSVMLQTFSIDEAIEEILIMAMFGFIIVVMVRSNRNPLNVCWQANNRSPC